MCGAQCILLVSSYTADPIQEQDQRRARDLLAAKKIAFEEVDGALEENKELRNALFNISSQRGKYPQFFLERDGRHEFIGLWEQVEVRFASVCFVSEWMGMCVVVGFLTRLAGCLVCVSRV